MRVFIVACALLGVFLTLQLPCQCSVVQASGSGNLVPAITAPARGDTVRSVWISVRGTVPSELVSGLREVEIYVNNAARTW